MRLDSYLGPAGQNANKVSYVGVLSFRGKLTINPHTCHPHHQITFDSNAQY